MEVQRLYSLLRQAISRYDMIEDGDKIAVGVSGGKDSLAMLYGLAGLRRFYPKSFDIEAITVDLGYAGFDTEPVRRLCEELQVNYTVVKTEIGNMVGDGQCSLCARLRKGAFNQKVLELGCNKIAYAHNKDDVVETMLLSLIYEGRFISFYPVTNLSMEGRSVKLIRPLMLTSQADVLGFVRKYKLQVVTNPCPYDKETERSYVRELLAEMNVHAPGVKSRLFTAIMNDFYEEELTRDLYRLITRRLIESSISISTMESITSGQIASLITDSEGSSAIFKGAFVTYSNEAKIMQSVPASVIEGYGVYSHETARAMARACQAAYKADIGIGVTGTAGNVDAANSDSVAGSVYYAVAFGEEIASYHIELPVMKERVDYKWRIARAVATELLRLFGDNKL